MNDTTKLARIDEQTAKAQPFACKDGCADCCGPVLMTRLEWKRIQRYTGRSSSEMEKESTRRLLANDLRCVFLDPQNRCSIYEVRPAICRIFGSSESESKSACLKCPHGCRPERMLTESETKSILDEVERLGR